MKRTTAKWDVASNGSAEGVGVVVSGMGQQSGGLFTG